MKVFAVTNLLRTLLPAATAAAVAVAVAIGAGCGSNGDNPSALVGQWVSINDGESVELFKDGTGVVDNRNITWKTEGKRFVLSRGSSSTVGDYNLSGYELTRTFEDGKAILWVKKDKVEEYKKKNTSYFTDTRNGQKYRAVKIGSKKWLAENLNYQTGTSWCYEDDESKCKQYGRLYDWNTAKTVCPSGWHLPSEGEWNDLETAAGGEVTGKVLKATSGWSNNGNGVDVAGFSALPGGLRSPDGAFFDVGQYGNWWTATERRGDEAYYRIMKYGDNDVYGRLNGKSFAFSVRCIQNETAAAQRESSGVSSQKYVRVIKDSTLIRYYLDPQAPYIKARKGDWFVLVDVGITGTWCKVVYEDTSGFVKMSDVEILNTKPTKADVVGLFGGVSEDKPAAARNGTFTDSRDGRKYKTVKMPDGKTWMAENLHFNVNGSKCYENRTDICNKYGRLYSWNEAKIACPKGWHLPSRGEWTKLVTEVGSSTSGGKKLKSTSGWNNNGNGTDDFGFTALPAGYFYTGGTRDGFADVGQQTYWWTATEEDDVSAYYRGILSLSDLVGERSEGKNQGYSVRCVEGPAASGGERKGVSGSGSGEIKGKSVSSTEIFAKGGFATDIDAILSNAGKGGSGYGSGFGGGVDDLHAGLMGGGGGGLELKKAGELKVSSPDFLKGGALDGARSRASIQRVVMQNMAALRYAYNKRLREKPGMAGEIKVKFSIDEFGKVISAQIVGSTMDDSELESTVVSRVNSWNFEKIDKPGDVTTVTYPFVFSP